MGSEMCIRDRVKGVSILFQQLVNTMPSISYSNIAQYGGMYASALRRV